MSTIPAITSALSAAQTASPTAKPASNATQVSGDTFLKLLVAQLQYQDPSKPADATQFLAQTAQFTMVEKLNSLDASITQLVAAQQSSAASAMLGQKVVATGADGTTQITGTVTAVKLNSTGPVLTVNGTDLPFASIREVDKP